jgi:hypothetical protein
VLPRHTPIEDDRAAHRFAIEVRIVGENYRRKSNDFARASLPILV